MTQNSQAHLRHTDSKTAFGYVLRVPEFNERDGGKFFNVTSNITGEEGGPHLHTRLILAEVYTAEKAQELKKKYLRWDLKIVPVAIEAKIETLQQESF